MPRKRTGACAGRSASAAASGSATGSTRCFRTRSRCRIATVRWRTCSSRALRCSRRRDMEFDPLLPDDDAALDERVDALSAWCQGFLYGFGTAATDRRAAPSGEVTEVLADFAEISRGGSVGLEPMEIEEDAYMELVEFLRVGVQLVYDELRTRTPPEPRPHHSSLSKHMTVRKDEFARRRRQLMRMMGKGGIAILPTAVGEAAQQRRALLLPAGQRFPLSDRLQRAGVGRGAGARPSAGGVHPVRPRSRPGPRDLGRQARRTRRRGARLRRRRCVSDRRHRRHPARPDRELRAGCTTRWASTPTSTIA